MAWSFVMSHALTLTMSQNLSMAAFSLTKNYLPDEMLSGDIVRQVPN